jgi:pseudouridine-5'-phosphate glycosidase
VNDTIVVAPDVGSALADGKPVVALETTIVAHGFPPGEGIAVGRDCEARVRERGAVPATVAVLDGAVRVGLEEHEIERVAEAAAGARKVGPRDLGPCVVDGAVGATTAGATLTVCRLSGIRVLATGGIGGVHRGYAVRPDFSADLGEVARTRAVVVCSGVKSLLDVDATLEVLETLGIPVVGYRTASLPLFYAATGGPPVPHRADSPKDAAAMARAHWGLGGRGVLVARPPAPSLEDVAPLIEGALRDAEEAGIRGHAVTPYVLALLHRRSGGRTLHVNHRLAADNAALAAEIAAAL